MIFFNQGMLLLGSNHFLTYEEISEVKVAEDSIVLPPKFIINNKERTKATEGTVEIENSKKSCDQLMALAYTLRTVNKY